MNQLILYYFWLLLFIGACSSPIEAFFPWDVSLSTEQNIAKNTIALENNDDFSFLDEIIRERSVLILGEEGHADYSTSITKIKAINYLQHKGFNSIAFEGQSFLTSYVFSNPKYAELTKNWKVSPFLQSTEDLIHNTNIYQAFLEKIRKLEISIYGIDCFSSEHDIDAVKTILNEYSDIDNLSINWDKLKKLYIRKFLLNYGQPNYQKLKLSVSEQYEFMRMIDFISNYTQYMMFLKGTIIELKAIIQWIKNLSTYFSYIEYNHLADGLIFDLVIRNRDVQMAENINWVINNFPEKKIIVWCANFHGTKDISQTRYPADSLFYFVFQSMGEHVYTAQGKKMYSLAFTSLRSEKDRGNLEIEIANATGNAPYAFIDFEPLRFADGYRDQEFESNVIMKKQGKWLYIFDGLYYIRDQKRE